MSSLTFFFQVCEFFERIWRGFKLFGKGNADISVRIEKILKLVLYLIENPN